MGGINYFSDDVQDATWFALPSRRSKNSESVVGFVWV